ncbi:hypothetical protein BVJ53_06410 [Lacticaseibacillus chiayiensis]|uniref:Uncharacterized protein n=2 Tax=Lacticaseibacillus chiayiensis TaxID=2100821 RepID=A0A4Q1U1S3_9LACO|nr:hypothetical protein BVJ53_06410 [Lacticaseibacillus chiayiensis]
MDRLNDVDGSLEPDVKDMDEVEGFTGGRVTDARSYTWTVIWGCWVKTSNRSLFLIDSFNGSMLTKAFTSELRLWITKFLAKTSTVIIF